MALGTALSQRLGLQNIDQQIVGDTKILMASINTKKSQFTHFLGAEDGRSEGLFLQWLDLWLSSTISYPVIIKIQELSLIVLLTFMFNEAIKLKCTLCQCYFDTINKISSLEIPTDKEDLLSMTIIEANKSSNTIMERMDLWFDTIKIKLNDVSNIINIDILASRTESPAGRTSGAAASSESSDGPPPGGPPPVGPPPGGPPPASPPVILNP